VEGKLAGEKKDREEGKRGYRRGIPAEFEEFHHEGKKKGQVIRRKEVPTRDHGRAGIEQLKEMLNSKIRKG